MIARQMTTASSPSPTTAPGGAGRRRLLHAAPAIAVAGLAPLLGWALTRNPRDLPSPLVGRLVPRFNLPPVRGRVLGLATSNLRGEVSLVNVFASWCVACRAEHPLFMAMARARVAPIHGLNYRDAPDAAARWLDTLGDPYTRTGADRDGRAGVEWGIHGVPETFVVSAEGRVVHRHVGPLTAQILDGTIKPLIARLRGDAERAPP